MMKQKQQRRFKVWSHTLITTLTYHRVSNQFFFSFFIYHVITKKELTRAYEELREEYGREIDEYNIKNGVDVSGEAALSEVLDNVCLQTIVVIALFAL